MTNGFLIASLVVAAVVSFDVGSGATTADGDFDLQGIVGDVAGAVAGSGLARTKLLLGALLCAALAVMAAQKAVRHDSDMRIHGASIPRVWRGDLAANARLSILSVLVVAGLFVGISFFSGGIDTGLVNTVVASTVLFAAFLVLIALLHLAGIRFAASGRALSTGAALSGRVSPSLPAAAYLVQVASAALLAGSLPWIQQQSGTIGILAALFVAGVAAATLIVSSVAAARAWVACNARRIYIDHIHGRSYVAAHRLFVLGEALALALTALLGAAYYQQAAGMAPAVGEAAFAPLQCTIALAVVCALSLLTSLATVDAESNRVCLALTRRP